MAAISLSDPIPLPDRKFAFLKNPAHGILLTISFFQRNKMKTTLTLTLLITSSLLFGCADYPQNEPSVTCPDIHKSGPGPYGGVDNPINSPTAPKANTTPATAPT
jgi:hypothetical protein